MEDNAKKIIEVIADELSMDEGEITLESHGVAKSRTRLSD